MLPPASEGLSLQFAECFSSIQPRFMLHLSIHSISEPVPIELRVQGQGQRKGQGACCQKFRLWLRAEYFSTFPRLVRHARALSFSSFRLPA